MQVALWYDAPATDADMAPPNLISIETITSPVVRAQTTTLRDHPAWAAIVLDWVSTNPCDAYNASSQTYRKSEDMAHYMHQEKYCLETQCA
jgi:hypothetical protein